MFFELSKDTDFDSIISKASLDVNTKKLIGKASKQDIIKSLHENMNSNNMPLYRKLIAKAEEEIDEEEQAFQTQLGGKGSQRAGLGLGQVEEQSLGDKVEQEKETASTKVEYRKFLKERKKYATLKNAIGSLKDLSQKIDIEKNAEMTSGYEFFNIDSYDNLVGKNIEKSNTIINAMNLLEKNPNALVESSDRIKNGILESPTPPNKLDAETQEYIKRNKKAPINVEEIQKELLDIMQIKYAVEGEEDMSFSDAFEKIHTNQFDRTPTLRRKPKEYLARINAAKRKLQDDRPKNFIAKVSKLKQLIEELKKLYELEIPLIERIATLESYEDKENRKELIEFANNKIKESLEVTADLKPETYGIGAESEEVVLGSKGIDVRKDKLMERILSSEMTKAKEELSKIQKKIDGIQQFEEEIEEITKLMSRVNRMDKSIFTHDKQEIDKLKNSYRILTEKFFEQEPEGTTINPNRVEFDNRLRELNTQITDLERENARYFSVVSKLNESYNIIFDTKDEMEKINQNLRRLQKSGELDAVKLAQDIKLSLLRGDTSDLRSDDYKSRLTSLSEEDLEETLDNADKTIEILNKLNVNVEEVKQTLELMKREAE